MKLKIGKTAYSVRIQDKPFRAPKNAYIDYATKEIVIASIGRYTNKRRTRNYMQLSLWHETVHGILKDMGHRLESNEQFVTAFSNRLVRVIRQVHPHDNVSSLVAQRAKGLRELRPEVSRGAGT